MVVFPALLGPTNATMLPLLTFNVTFLTVPGHASTENCGNAG